MSRTGVLAALLLLTATGLRAQSAAPPELRLRPGDLVRLQVAGEAEMAGDYPIAEDGAVLLPLVGLVPVAGRPFGEVRAEIRSAFAAELRDAAVVVTPVLRIAVLGEVRQPGLLPVDPTLDVADVLAAAGGLTPSGDPGRILLLRDGRTLRLSLDDGAAAVGERLQPGDQLLVERRGWARENLNVLLGAGASIAAAAITALLLR